MPSIEQIAEMIARRDKARIVPTGIYALNKLGISTQVPMNNRLDKRYRTLSTSNFRPM